MGEVTYSVEKIGLPTGTGFSGAVALNNRGQVVGYSRNSGTGT